MGTHCMATWISHHLWQLMSSGRQNRTFANLLQLQGTPGDAVPQYPVLTTYLPLGFLEPDLPLYSVTVCYSSPRRIRVTHFRSGANATLTLSCTLCTHISPKKHTQTKIWLLWLLTSAALADDAAPQPLVIPASEYL